MFALSAFAGEIMDEFDAPDLHPEVWKIETAEKASFKIKDGQLIMESPAAADGILLRYVPKIAGEDITFEYKLDTSQGGEPNAQIWFSDEPLAPDVNTDVNLHWILVQTIWQGNTYVKDAGGKVIPDTPVKDDANVYQFVLEGAKVTFSVNGKEAGTVNMPDKMNYFHISSATELFTNFGTAKAKRTKSLSSVPSLCSLRLCGSKRNM